MCSATSTIWESSFAGPAGADEAHFSKKCSRSLTISVLDGGQSVSHVLQWKVKLSDFKASSNCALLNETV